MDLSKELEIAKKAAIAAGKAIMKIYHEDFSVDYKEDKSPLTKADQESNQIILDYLIPQFPEYAVLSEESVDDLSRLNNHWCWIIDPLDGTKEFIKKNGEFTVNIALTYQQQPILGVIYVPVTEELYYAAQNIGAFHLKNEKISPLKVSNRTKDLRLVMSRSHPDSRLENLIKKYNIQNTKSAGSSLKGCLIAKGEAEIYYRFGLTMEWDTAAMQCIAEQAGATFRQMDDTEMLYNRQNSLNDKGFYILNRIENKMS